MPRSKEEKKEYDRLYYIENKKRIDERHKKYRLKHLEEYNIYNKKRYWDDPERFKADKREYYLEKSYEKNKEVWKENLKNKGKNYIKKN